MSFLWITIPATLALAGALLGWVLHEARNGGLDDLEAPGLRAALDDDSIPELDAATGHSAPSDAAPERVRG